MNGVRFLAKVTLCLLCLLLREGSSSSLADDVDDSDSNVVTDADIRTDTDTDTDTVGRSTQLGEFAAAFGGNWSSRVTICESLQCEHDIFISQTHPAVSPSSLVVYFPSVHIKIDPFFFMYMGTVLDLFLLCDDVHIVISSLSHMLRRPFVTMKDYQALLAWSEDDCSVHTSLRLRSGSGSGDHTLPVTEVIPLPDCQDFKAQRTLLGGAVLASSSKRVLVSVVGAHIVLDTLVHMTPASPSRPPPIILHLNNEAPWQASAEALAAQLRVYSGAFHVFRTVFFKGFQLLATYLPLRSSFLLTASFLSPPLQTHLQYASRQALAAIPSAASARPLLCSFAGGMTYAALQGGVSNDRRQMMDALGNFSACTFFDSKDNLSPKLSEAEYTMLTRYKHQ